MKRTSLIASVAVMLLTATSVFAQDRTVRQDTVRQDQVRQNKDLVQAGQLDDKLTGTLVRASALEGMSIWNAEGENVGTVSDLVIDGQTGRVRYAAVTYGGFLGVGNKMFAVPFEAFKVLPNKHDRDEYLLVLNVTQEQLEGAEGFDEEHWPNFADPEFTSQLDKRYGVQRNMDDRNQLDRNRDDNQIDDDK